MKISRNAQCPCGSGKKYKQCCEAKAAAKKRNPMPGLLVVGAILALGVAALVWTFSEGPSPQGRVWSEEPGASGAPNAAP